jgi:hypothetical protein
MRCQDFERLILESRERELSREEQRSIENHLAQCASCNRFREFWLGLRIPIQNSPAADLPPDLDDRVRLSCHDALETSGGKRRRAQPSAPRQSAPVPWPIWAALSVLTVLTLAFLIPGILEFWQNQKLTPGIVLVLVLILQNALALFFVPIIVRRQQWNRLDLGGV